MINILSNLMIPFLVFIVVLYGIYKKVAVYDVFVEGAKESFELILTLFPCMLGMLLGVSLLLNCGVLEFLFSLLKPMVSWIKLPFELLPMMFLRSVSGSTTLAMLNEFFVKYGPDSWIGRLSSVMQGATDTTVYILTLYFGSVGIHKTKYALKAGLFADFVGILASIFFVWLFFH